MVDNDTNRGTPFVDLIWTYKILLFKNFQQVFSISVDNEFITIKSMTYGRQRQLSHGEDKEKEKGK